MPEVLASKAVFIVFVLVLLFVLERLFPVARWVGGIWRVVKNLGFGALNAALSPLIVVPLTLYASNHSLDWRPDMWSGTGVVLLDLLVLDLWIYWWHRLNHRLPLLWRFHEVHHLDDTLDVTSALRFHCGEVLLSSVVRGGVIYLLDVPFATVLVFETSVALAAMFQHSNLRLPEWLERPLSLVVVTPSIHWVHHHAIRRDTDSNYANILSVWDRLFGSCSRTVRTADMAIGVEGLKDKPALDLLIRPFRPR
jgi:sterol desaturase/sphingolipid hydroxylase (fatty acid hydroxylase superfamily)